MIKNACRYLMSMLVVLGAAATADADELSSCFRRASIRYDISQRLLEAIAHVESSGNPMAVNQNSNGSEDIGLMQINSFWLPKLEEYGSVRSLREHRGRGVDSGGQYPPAWLQLGSGRRL